MSREKSYIVRKSNLFCSNKERSYLVKEAKEVRTVKEVMACDVFRTHNLYKPNTYHQGSILNVHWEDVAKRRKFPRLFKILFVYLLPGKLLF